MSKPPYYKTLSGPQIFVWRMFLFVVLVGLLAGIFHEKILELVNFNSSTPLKLLIAGVLVFGILLTFQQVLRLYPEVRWVNNFRISDPGIAMDHAPVMLAPMAMMLRRRQGQAAISATAMRSILDSIGSRLDESRETTRYLVGLLIFLGLIGTFWGLLITTGSVGETIRALNTEGKETAQVFQELKTSLEAPLAGMGTAFSASLLGLAGSLILGFLDIQAGQAQSRFYNDLEEWLSTITESSRRGHGRRAWIAVAAPFRDPRHAAQHVRPRREDRARRHARRRAKWRHAAAHRRHRQARAADAGRAESPPRMGRRPIASSGGAGCRSERAEQACRRAPGDSRPRAPPRYRRPATAPRS